MPLSTRDRKLLWARAGGTCTFCKSPLTAEATGEDRDVVLGEEAHIVSEEPNGPRFRLMPSHTVDTYANLMLLCPSHHKIVDDQVTSYTEERLHALKREHEQWVKDKISPAIPSIKVRDPEADKPVVLQRIDTGRELMSIAAYTLAVHHDHPEPQSSEEAALMGQFFQNILDCINIWDHVGPSGRREAEFPMSEDMKQLREAALIVYAGKKKHIIEGGMKAPEPWPVAYIVISRSDDAPIQTGATDMK